MIGLISFFKTAILFLSTAFVLSFPSLVQAQSEVVGYETRCLKIEETYFPTCSSNYECKSLDPAKYPNPQKKDHTLKISGTGFPSNVDIYIVGCVSTGNNYMCTARTGDTRLNRELTRLGFDAEANPTVGGEVYEFEILENPVRADGDKVEMIVRSATANPEDHRFFGIIPLSGDGIPREKTVQFGELVFTQDPSECISIYWDPAGRVFDAKSLEPLPDVRVRILDESENLLPARPGFKPEKLTGPDGVFTFMVPEGRYKLEVEKTGYSFPVDISDINPGFSKAYSCDPEVGAELYNDKYIIEERGKLIQCDIPLNPLGTPYEGEVVIFDYGHLILPSGKVGFTARFSHPFSIGILREEGSGRVVARAQSDKNGRWRVELSLKEVPQDRSLVLEVEKVNLALSKDGWFRKIVGRIKEVLTYKIKAKASTNLYRTKVKFEPILSYIEGYVYDDKKKVLPYAKVKIISYSTGNVLLEAQADGNGFIRILPEYLPRFPYYLQIESENKVYAYTTSQFVSLNKDYLEKESLDLVKNQKAGKPITFPTEEREKIKAQYLKADENRKVEKAKLTPSPVYYKDISSEGEQAKRFLWGIIGLLFIMLVSIAGSIFFYLKRDSFKS